MMVTERMLRQLIFRPLGALRAHLLARTRDDKAAALIARRDLARYYNALGDTLVELRATFSATERACLIEATAGIAYSERDYNGIIADLRRYIDRTGGALGEEHRNLSERVTVLSPFARLTLVDALERVHLAKGDAASLFADMPVVSLPGSTDGANTAH